MAQQKNRRDFIKESTALGAAWWVGNSALQAEESKSANEQINFACIGVGGKGSSDSNSAGQAGKIVALCDIDDNRLKGKANAYKDAEKFNDYREMLDKMGDKIDAVTVSTPDHSHAPASVMAMKMGKHCFCQKPMTWSVGEARIMRELAAEKGLCTQMGNQGTSNEKLRDGVDIVKAGVIGNVKEVHVWTNRPIWPQGTGRPKGQEPPKTVHWDLFLGPAPHREYSPAYHPFKWRGWLDFGTGALGDMACHTMNMPVWAADLFEPTSVEAVETDGVFENETYPKYTVLKYEFPKTETRGPVTMYWYDGGKKPPASLLKGKGKLKNSGAILVGELGSLYSPGDYGGEGNILIPHDENTEFKKWERKLPKSPGHFTEFKNAIQKGDHSLAYSNFSYAGRLTETVLLGNLAVRLGRKVEWNAETMNKDDKDVAKLVMRDYREGWSL